MTHHLRARDAASPLIAQPLPRPDDFGCIRRLGAVAVVLMSLAINGSGVALGQATAPATQPEPHHHEVGTRTPVTSAPAVDDPRAQSLFEEGRAALGDGSFAKAVALLAEARTRFADAGQAAAYADATVSLAAAHTALGRTDKAIEACSEALEVAQRAQDPVREARLLAARGRSAMFSRQADSAEGDLLSAEIIVRRQDDQSLLSEIANDQANLYAARGQTVRALDAYDTASAAAEASEDAMSEAVIAINAALAAVQGEHSTARERAERASRLADRLPETGYTTIHALITLSDVWAGLSKAGGPPDDAMRSYSVAMKAATLAAEAKNPMLEAHAWGRLGTLYAAQNRPDDALFASRKAVFLAQQSQSPDATFRFQWQLGRQLRDRGEIEPAIEAYKRAIVALRGIRHDLAIGYGNANSRTSFRQSVGPVFYEAADLLLRKADQLGDDALRQESLRLARDTIEELKSAELEDYFQDDCVNLVRQKSRGIDIGLVNTAIVYLIPLEDRTEILLSTPRGLQRFRGAVTERELSAEARELRLRLEDELDYGYRVHAARLYDWLIRPIEAALSSEAIDTLVFVPDGELRTIPMAALFDREAKLHLIERFAIGVSPGLELTDPKPFAARKNVELLAAGLSESRQEFPALPNVPGELEEIGTLYGGIRLQDSEFQRQAFANQFRGDTFTIVHIASHGKFEGNARDTFVLTYDGRLNLNDLEKLIQPSQFRGEAVELLTLSACQTAAGDDGQRAALGLAGVAIKAGARSALASLWSVNDAASSELIGNFYRQLRENPTQTKAKALQAAQLQLLRQPRYRHPRYWAPYLIIGNWQ